MYDPIQDFWQTLDTALTQLAQEVEVTLDSALDEALDAAMLQWLDLAEPMLETAEAVGASVNQSLQPLADGQTACAGCRHYHGQAYGGTILVCAMYPYGPEEQSCRDWDSTWHHLGQQIGQQVSERLRRALDSFGDNFGSPPS